MNTDALTWLGILLCVLQSGSFSGLNLALFGIGRVQLVAKARAGDADAERLLALRNDSNFLLATILWGNVGTNVLLTLLTDSVLAGLAGFAFSTILITFGGEIIPQAYFSRNALRMATLLRPLLRLWQILLFPIAKPTGLFLDAWLGKEGYEYLGEEEIRNAVMLYIAAPDSDVGRVEGVGALNFFSLDDLKIREEGEEVDPRSVIRLSAADGEPVFPPVQAALNDPFLRKVAASGKRWAVITGEDGGVLAVLDVSRLLRRAVVANGPLDPRDSCHRPVVVHDPDTALHDVVPQLAVQRQRAGDDVVDQDVVLLWADEEKRILTGADLLGRLLRGIVKVA